MLYVTVAYLNDDVPDSFNVSTYKLNDNYFGMPDNYKEKLIKVIFNKFLYVYPVFIVISDKEIGDYYQLLVNNIPCLEDFSYDFRIPYIQTEFLVYYTRENVLEASTFLAVDILDDFLLQREIIHEAGFKVKGTTKDRDIDDKGIGNFKRVDNCRYMCIQ